MEAYSLHSVRKPLAKPCKKPSNAPKVYRVDPMNFRDLVQKLTAAPEFMSPSHQTSSSQFQLPRGVSPSSSQNQNFSDNTMVTSNSSLGSNPPPSSYNWCAFPVHGPGTFSSLDQSFVP